MSARRGRWASRWWGSFHRETRAVGRRVTWQVGEWAVGVVSTRNEGVGTSARCGSRFIAKRGRWDVAAMWQVGGCAVVVVVMWQMGGWPVGVVST